MKDKADCTALNADDVVRKVDQLTVEFNLAFASGAFIKFLAIDYAKILPKHLLEQDIDLNLAENILRHGATSGPFILEDYQSGNHYKVNKNPDYFKEGLPYFDRIEHFIITVPATFIAQVEAGQIDASNAAANNLTAPENYAIETSTNSQYVAHEVLGGTRGFHAQHKAGAPKRPPGTASHQPGGGPAEGERTGAARGRSGPLPAGRFGS